MRTSPATERQIARSTASTACETRTAPAVRPSTMIGIDGEQQVLAERLRAALALVGAAAERRRAISGRPA